jgi:carbamoyltransferase
LTSAILGISAFYHDSAAALIVDGKIIAAAQEERFTRIKYDAAFPQQAVAYVLKEAGLDLQDLDAIVFYDKPLLKFERLLETYHAFVPRGLTSFRTAIPVWIKEKLFMKRLLRRALGLSRKSKVPILFCEHHLSHAASAFYPSPFEEAAIITIDGVGEWATTTICHGTEKGIRILRELHFPHSIGLLYSAFTHYLGFKVNSGEYKLMGLAPFGHADSQQTIEFKAKIHSGLVDLREDGSILLNMDYFKFATGLTMTHDRKWEQLFDLPRRKPETAISQSHANLALAIQEILGDIVVSLARTAKEITGSSNLVMAGGVALNCVANSRLAAAELFDNIWIQPAAGDAGGALGAALAAYYILGNKKRVKPQGADAMQNAYLGPGYSDQDIQRVMSKYRAEADYFSEFAELSALISHKIAEGKVIGWFQGRMEFGPRALGNRSILADPANPTMQKRLNEKIKSRENFRPFAPSVLAEDAADYFDGSIPSPYMLFVASLKKSLRKPPSGSGMDEELHDRPYEPRSDFPAVTHMDYSARIQTVERESNPRFWQLIRDFKTITGCPMLVNTSFNVRGEPVVCSPADAYACFIRTEMDYLVMGNYLFEKDRQKKTSAEIRNFNPD